MVIYSISTFFALFLAASYVVDLSVTLTITGLLVSIITFLVGKIVGENKMERVIKEHDSNPNAHGLSVLKAEFIHIEERISEILDILKKNKS